MKFLNAILIITASVLITTEAAFEKPEKVIARIDELKGDVFNYQDKVVSALATYRQASGQDAAGYSNRTIVIIENSIKEIAASDLQTRSVLDAEPQTACIANLLSFLNQILELSGYAISNCIEMENSTTVSIDFTAQLNAIGKDASSLGEIIIKALTGRNVFTQGDEIIERVENLLAHEKSVLDAALADLASKAEGIVKAWEDSFVSLQGCYTDTDQSTKSGLSVIAAQLPVCQKFNGRGARSAIPFSLPDPKDFFPQLH